MDFALLAASIRMGGAEIARMGGDEDGFESSSDDDDHDIWIPPKKREMGI
jgi:hypothetical protein